MLELKIEHSVGNIALSIDEKVISRAVGIYGPSGSGKTSLLNCISGLLKPDYGDIVLNGQHLYASEADFSLPVDKRAIATVFQNSRLFPHLSVEKNLFYGRKRIRNKEPLYDPQKVINTLELGPLLKRMPLQLSGGEAQRVSIGRALLYEPQLLLFDEPLSSLDKRLKVQIMGLIEKLVGELEIPFLYVSHDIQELAYLCDTLLTLEKGQCKTGSIDELLRRDFHTNPLHSIQ